MTPPKDGVQNDQPVKPDAPASASPSPDAKPAQPADAAAREDRRQDEKLKKIWKDAGFTARAQALVESGVLTQKNGAEVLREKLNEEFFKDSPRKITKRVFETRLANLIWADKKRLELLSEFVKYDDQPLESVYQLLAYLPRSLVDKQAKRMRGRAPAGKKKTNEFFEAGVGRLVTDEEVAKGVVIPHKAYTLDNPFELAVRDKDNFNIAFIQPLLGTRYDRNIDGNPVRNMIRYCREKNFDAIVLPGALVWADLAMAGKLLTHRAEISSYEFDAQFVDPDYREKALEIRETRPPGEMVFITLREEIISIIQGGYRKLTLHKNGKPIFDGKIYIGFGRTEWELILTASSAHATYIMRRMIQRVVAERMAARAKLSYVLKAGGRNSPEARKLQDEVDRLTKEEQRYRVRNVYRKERRRVTGIIQSLLIQWFKDAVPNSEFITLGDAVCSVGGKKGKIISISQVPDEKAADNALARKVQGAGIRELAGRLPDVELIAGAYNLNMRHSTRERIKDGERAVTHLVQLPVAVDREHARSVLGHLPKSATPYERLVFDSRFEPGALHLQYTDGLWVFHKLDMRMFKTRKVLGMTDRESTPYFDYLANGDEHAGSRSRLWFLDGMTGMRVPLEIAVSLILTRNFTDKKKPLPIHGFGSTGDQVQAHHFPTQQGVHPKQRSIGDVQELNRKLLERAKDMTEAQLRKAIGDLAADLEFQLTVRGEDWTIRQIIDYLRHSLRPRDLFFHEILKSYRRGKLKITGVGEAQPGGRENAFDARNMGAISFVGGNHIENATEKEITEGPLYSIHMAVLLRALKGCAFTEEELHDLVRGPMWGDIPIGYGLWTAQEQKHPYTWGMQIRHDPARKSKQNADPLLNEVSNIIETGNYSRIFLGREFIGINGDVHRMGAAFGPGFTLVSCGSCTDGDHYGAALGFSRSTAGAMIVGIPAWGPESGSIRVIPLTHDFIRRYLAKPWPVRWDEIFKNAL